MKVFGAIEAGGTKFVCGIGTSPDDLETIRIPTTTPEDTIAAVVHWFRAQSAGRIDAVGIGSFGPLDLDSGSPGFGKITSTPKAAWRNYDIRGEVQKALGIPVYIDTDVNAALRGESRWGAARGMPGCLYLTVGTGIGGACDTGHAEMGHIRIPHDGTFPGVCPYHGDCLEGLASGPAMAARWGRAASELPPDHPAWATEARYLALAIANFTLTLSPRRILLGGGVMRREQLFEAIRREVELILAGYVAAPEILPPGLGERAGVLGALALCAE